MEAWREEQEKEEGEAVHGDENPLSGLTNSFIDSSNGLYCRNSLGESRGADPTVSRDIRMTIIGHQRLTKILVLLLSSLVLLCGWLIWRFGWQSIEIGLADEQTWVFERMTSQASRSNAGEAAECLQYVVDYYPSGTKQQTGSKVDRIVERDRAHAIREIIGYLRQKTGEDLGDDPEQWIRKFAHR
jgi:hypothetical protein